MSEPPDEDSSRHAHRRLQAFLDCIAYLIARRWLREQRQQDKNLPQEKPTPDDEQAE